VRPAARASVAATSSVLSARRASPAPERPAQNRRDILVAECAQHQHAGAREQRRNYLEGGILGGRADERDESAFDVGQDGVLLRAVPSMDLVDENHRAAPAGFKFAPRFFDRLAQLAYSGRYSGDRTKARAGLSREQKRDRGLAAPRRPPQDYRRQRARREHPAEHLVGAKQMLLADDLVEAPRAHPVRQRLGGWRPGGEETWLWRFTMPPGHTLDRSTAASPAASDTFRAGITPYCLPARHAYPSLGGRAGHGRRHHRNDRRNRYRRIDH
jgi:hypothetical protein